MADDELNALRVQMDHTAAVAAKPQYPLAPTTAPKEPVWRDSPSGGYYDDGLGHYSNNGGNSWDYTPPASTYPLAPSIAPSAPVAAPVDPYGSPAPYVTPDTAPADYSGTPSWPTYPTQQDFVAADRGMDTTSQFRPDWGVMTTPAEQGGGGVFGGLKSAAGAVGGGIKDFAGDYVDVLQKNRPGGAITNLGAQPAGMEGRNSTAVQEQTQKLATDMLSGNALAKDLTGKDLRNLPYGLGYVTDAALAPATWATIAAGPAVPILGSTFGGGLATRAVGEIGVNAAGNFAGQKSAEKAAEYTDNPWLIGGAGVLGGLAGAGGVIGAVGAAKRAPGVVKAADRALTGLDARIMEPAGSFGGPITAGSSAEMPSLGTVTARSATGEARAYELPTGETLKQIPSGPDRGKWKLTSTDEKTTVIASTPEAAVALVRDVNNPLRVMESRWNADRHGWDVKSADGTAGTQTTSQRKVGAATWNADAPAARPTPDVLVNAATTPSEGVLGPVKPRAAEPPPPPKPPVAAGGVTPPPRTPRVAEAPLGDSGARAAIALKTETTAGPGRLANVPGAKKVAGIVNPSVNLEPEIHIANQAEAAVVSDVATALAATRKPLVEQVDNAFRKAPEYIGPPENPIKGTFIDIAENPGDYVLTPQQKNLLDAIGARDADNVNRVRSEYNSDIGLYTPQNEGAIYVPHINTNEDLVKRVASAEASLSNPRIAKERTWDTARERAIHDPTFKPETDAARLLEAHDNAIASAAGKQTFAIGSGGLTRVEAVEQLRPGLKAARDAAQNELDSLNGQLDTALRQQGGAIKDFKANGVQERRIEARMAPMEKRVAELQALGDSGPEMSHLSGQLYELRHKAAQLEAAQRISTKTRTAAGPKVVAKGERVNVLLDKIEAAQVRAEKLADRYKSVNLSGGDSPLVMNKLTFKYHTPEASASIDAVKQMSNGGIVDKVTDFAEGQRATALSSDISPITIQGQMNLWRDPVSTAVGAARMIREGGPSLDAVARAEPEMVARYVQATGVPFGNVSPEFSPAKSWLAKIPKAGEKLVAAEDKLFELIQRLNYEAWKRNVSFATKHQPGVSQNVIDHEVANILSKTVPSMSSVERGVSPARGRLERSVFTSTSFMMSQALLAKDATSGLAKIMAHPLAAAKGDFSALRGRELIAVKQSLTIAATIQTVTLASAALTAEDRGMSPEMAVRRALNPDNGTFMSLSLPGGVNVPLGGPFRSFIRGVSPKYRDGQWQGPDLVRFAESKLGPSPSMTKDLAFNKDYSGNTIRHGNVLEQILQSLEYFGESSAPLTAGAAMEGVRTGADGRDIVNSVISQAAGSNINFQSDYEAKNVQARKAYGKDWDQLSPEEQNALKAVPGSPAATYQSTNPAAVASKERKAADRTEMVGYQSGVDTAYIDPVKLVPKTPDDGKRWRDEYHIGVEKQQTQYAKDARDFPYTGPESKDPTRAALAERGALMEANKVGSKINWDVIDAWSVANPEKQKLIDAYFADPNKPNTDLTPAVTAYKAASKAIGDSGLFDIRDASWATLQKNAAYLKRYTSYEDYTKAATDAVVEQMVKYGKTEEEATQLAPSVLGSNAVVQAMNDLNKAGDYAWIRAHPKEALLAVQWGYISGKEKIAFIQSLNR